MVRPLVSVITITRNRANMIGRCIKSVLSQSYSNLEHIVIDGSSEDNTDDVVAGFKDDRLRYEKLAWNWPIKETLDYGITLCRGEYITFLDSDDEYVPSKIEKQLKLIESLTEEYGFVYCWMTYYDVANNNTVEYVHAPQLKGLVRDEVLAKPIISGTPSLFFRARFLRELGGWKSVDEIGIISDWELCARACQKSKVDFVPESLVNVYENHGSVRQSEDTKYYDSVYKRRIKFHKYFLTEFQENFKRCPEIALNHQSAIMKYEFKLHNYFVAGKCLLKMFLTHPFLLIKKASHNRNSYADKNR